MTNTINGQKDHGTRKSFLLKPLSYSFALHRRALAGSALALSFLGSEMVLAAPQGGVVVGGDGSISVDGKITNVDQASDLLAIDWETFNVDADEMVRFIQSSSSDMVLNRILDENPSAIFGTIDAKGHVLLVNPRGLLFTETSQINVNSLVASGLDIKTEDFMNGNYIFEGKAGTEGYVINKGSISAVSGAVLQGKSVHNTGLVSGGLVALAAGNEAVVTFDADQLIGVKVTKEVLEKKLGIDDAVLNEGTLKGGEVLLTADVAKGLFDNAVNNTGIIEAKGISTEGGVVRLGGFGANVAHSGKIDVSGEGSGSKGGKVQIEGNTINLTGNASIVATGEKGGGTVLIGGDYQGKNADVYNAKNVTVAENVTIDASATENGDGGKVIVWSDDTAEFHGEITARGGKNGGDGGFVETSGKKRLFVTGTVNAGAEKGENGSWLLDPEVTIVVDQATYDAVVNHNGDLSVSEPADNISYVTTTALENSLANGADITIQASSSDPEKGSITVASDIIYKHDQAWPKSGDPTLSLQADNNVFINANIKSQKWDSLNSEFIDNGSRFNVDIDAGNTVHINDGILVDTQGGTFTSNSHNFVNEGTVKLIGDGFLESAAQLKITVGRDNGSESKNFLGDLQGFSSPIIKADSTNDIFIQSNGTIVLSGTEYAVTLNDIGLENVETVVSGTASVSSDGTVTENISAGSGTLTGTSDEDTFIVNADGSITSELTNFQGIGVLDGKENEDTVDDSTLNSDWKVTLTGASKTDDSLQILNAEIVKSTGSVTNASGTSQSVILNANSLKLSEITFEDSKSYTGHVTDQGAVTDTITDNTATDTWRVTAHQQDAETVNKAETLAGHVLTNVQAINRDNGAAVSNATAGGLDVTLTDDSLDVAGISFGNSKQYTGHSTEADNITDSTTVPGDVIWTVTGDGDTDNGTYTLVDVDRVTRNSDYEVVGRADPDTGWSVSDNKTASDGSLEFVGVTALNTSSNSVTNATGEQQTVSLTAEGNFSFEDITVTGSQSYIGRTLTVQDIANGELRDIVQDGYGDVELWELQSQVNSAKQGNYTFTNIGTVNTGDQVENKSGTEQIVTIPEGGVGFSVAGITFDSSSVYIGAGSDRVEDNTKLDTAQDFSLMAMNRVQYKGYDFQQVSDVETTAAVDNQFEGGQVVVLAGSGLTVGGVTFEGSNKYTGHSSNTDTVTDNTGTARWDVTGNYAAKSADSHELANILQISGNASAIVKNETGTGQAVILNADSLKVSNITFEGNKSYTGHVTDQGAVTDTVSDNTGNDWSLTALNTANNGQYYLSKISEITSTDAEVTNQMGSLTVDLSSDNLAVGGIKFREVDAYVGSSAYDSVDDTQGSNWFVTADNTANNITYRFSNINEVDTTGEVTNASNANQDVTVDGDSIFLAGIDFIGSRVFNGAANFDELVIDSSNRDWTLAAANQLTGNGFTLNEVNQVTTQGGVTDGLQSNWTLQATGQGETSKANSVDAGITVVNSSRITTTGSVTNSSGAGQILTLTDSGGYSVAGITFDGSSVYLGGGSDTVDDNSTISDEKAFDLTGADEVTYKGYSFSQINRVESTAKVTDNANTGSWTVDGNTIATGGSITFAGVSQVTTTQGVTNNTGLSQAVDMGASAIALAGITFTGSQSYIGSDSKTDTVIDTTNTGWSITGNRKLTDNTRNLSNVEQINTSGDITDNGNTAWSVDGQNLIVSADQGITVSGTKRLVTEGNITDSTNQGWAVKGDKSAYSSTNDLTVDNSSQITTTGSVTNDSNANQNVDLNTNSLVLAGMTFAGSKTYIGGASTLDTVTDTTDTDWNVTGVKALTDGSRTLSNVDRLNASGAMTDEGNTAWSVDGKNQISSADQELTISGTSSLTTAGDITDKGNTAWSVDGANLISSNDQGITVSGTAKLATQGNITDTTNKGWAVQGDNVAFSSDNDLTIDGTGQITTTGGVTNASGVTQTVNLNNNNLTVAGISFMGSTAYTGGDGNADTATDNNGNDWSLTALNTANDGNYYLSKVSGITADTAKVTNNTGGSLKVDLNSDNLEVGAIQFKGVTSYEGDSTYDSVNDTQDSNWLVTGDNTANNTTYSFSNINAVTTTGEVTNDSNAQQDVTVDGDSIFLAGIDFIGSRIFNGATNFDDLVVDSSNRAWTLAAASQLSGNGFTLNNVEQITTNGNITDNLNSDWSLEAVSQNQNTVAKSTTGKMTVINSTRIASTGSVTNNSGSAQTLLLEDSGYTVAGISFDGSKVYIGTSGLNDIIDDETSTQASNSYTIEEAGKVTYQGYTFSEINEVQSQADVIDSVGSNWSVTGNTIASDGTITFKGMDAIQTVGGVTNNTNAVQAVTLNTSSLTVAGITFDGSQNYTGSDSKKDTVTDSTNGAWSITGNRTLTDNTRNLSQVEQINTSGDITDSQNTAWSVTGTKVATSDSMGVTVDGTSQLATTGGISNDTNADQLVILNASSLSVAGITFDGSQNYTGSDSKKDTVSDSTNGAWSITGNRTLTDTNRNLSQVEQINTSGNITDSQNTAWSVTGTKVATSDSMGITVDGTSQLATTGGISNDTNADQLVILNASSLSVAGITFDGSQNYTGSDSKKDTVTDSTNGAWSITGNRTLTDNTRNLSKVEQINTSGDITDSQNTAWSVTGTKVATSDSMGITVDGTSQLATTGGISNDTNADQLVILNASSLSVAGITFDGSQNYTGSDSKKDTVTDSTNGAWSITGNRTLTDNTRNLSQVEQINTSGNITDSQNTAWSVTGTKVATSDSMGITVDGTGQIATSGSVTNASDSPQQVQLNNSDITVDGIAFAGSKDYFGRAGNQDTAIDNTGNDWSLTALNTANNGQYYLSKISEITSTDAEVTNQMGSLTVDLSSDNLAVGGIKFREVDAYVGSSAYDSVDDTQGSNWFVTADNTANNITYRFSNINEVDTTGEVTNASNANQDVTVDGDSIFLAGIDFIGSRVFNGAANFDELVIDSSNRDWTLAAANQLTGNGFTLNEVNQVTTQGGVTDSLQSNWTLQATGQGETSKANSVDAGITVVNSSRITTTGSVTNSSGAGQILTLTDSAGYSVAGITFDGSSVYMGGGSDTVDDNSTISDEKAFDLTGTGEVTYKGYSFSQINRVESTAKVTDNANTGSWTVDGNTIATGGSITFAGVSQVTTTQGVTNNTGLSQAVDMGASAIALAGITFTGSQSYIGSDSKTDTVIDTTNTGWSITGNRKLTDNTRNLSNVEQINTSGDITDKGNTAWSVDGQNLIASANQGITVSGTKRLVTEGNITDSTNQSWAVKGDKSAYSSTNDLTVDNSSQITTIGSVTNDSNANQNVDLNTNSLVLAGMTFAGSKTYIGGASTLDTVTDTTDTDWNVTGVKALADGSRTLSNVDRLNASGAMTDEGNTAWSVDGKNLISSADQELTISGTSSLTTAGDITDKGNTAWSVDGANLISSNDQGITVSGTTKLATQGNITDTTNKGWAVQGDNVAFSSDNALTIDGTGQITTTGGITNASGETQAITLNSNHIKVAGIAFMGSTAYTGGDGNADTATDNNGNDWSLTALNTANDGNYYLSKVSGITTDTAKVTNNTGGSLKVDLNSDNLEVGAIQFKGVTSYEGDSTYDSVNDTQDSNWLVTGDNTANNTTYSFSNINAVTTTGEVTNDSNAQQDVTVDGDSIFLAGIDFIGSRIFNGATNFDDLVVDSSNRAWTLAAASQLSGNGFTLNNVEQITTNGNITDNLNSDWSLEAVSQNQNTVAKSTTGKMTVINSTRIASTGSVTNNSGSAQTLLLEDSGYTVAGISFDGSKVYIGTSGLNDIIDDETSTQASNSYTIEEAGKVTYQGYTFSEINEVQSQADVIDSVGSNWSVTGNTIASDGTITFKGMDAIQTVGGVTNNTNAVQAVTLNTSSLTVAGITFDGSQNYTGSDSKKDTVTDSTNGAWSITGNRTLTDNTRNLSNVEQINTSGDITDNGNTAWSVDGQNLIVSADQGITVSGTERLVTEGNITDSTNQGWAVKGDKSAYSSTNDLTVDNSSQITTTGSVTNDSNANQNVDLNTNSLVLAGMTFAGSKTYIGGASTLDTVTDNTGNAWDLTGNQALSNTTHNLSNVNQLNTVGDITDSNNGNWSVAGNNLASSTSYNVVIDGTGRIVTAGSATNASNSDQTVDLNTNSLVLAGMTFAGSKTYIGGASTLDTVTDTTDTDWNVTGVKALADGSRTLSNVDRLNASGAMTDEGNTAWSVDGKNLISSADQELTISGTSSLTTAGDITDKGNTAWSVDGANLISSNDQGITVSGTTKLATQGNITDTTNKGWAVQGDNVAFSSDNALTIDGTGQITTTGGITNASGETQAITLNSNHIKVAGIAFMGSTAYTGGDGNADTATDNNGNDWSLTALNTANDGNYYLSKVSGITTDTAKVTNNTGGSLKVDLNSDNLEVGAIQFKGVTSYEGDSTYDSVNDTQDSNWLVTGDNTANNTTYSFSNINAVTTTGEVTNDSNAQQDVTVDGDSIFLAGIDFIGSRIFNGATNFDDLVVDSSNRAWTLAAASQLSGNGFTLNNVEQITTNGNITDNLNSDWSLEAVSQNQNTVAKSTTGKMTVINSTRIASTGSVTNNSGSAQTLLLEDSGYTVAGISFDGSKVYIGTSGLNDIIDDETSTQASNSYTIEEAGKVTYQGYTFSEINEVQSQADVIDSVGSNWSVTGNTIASDGTITFKGMDAIQTVGGVTNNTNAVQAVTLNTSSLTVAGITFDGSQNYTGSDSKKDTVTDSTNGAWSITGNRTLTDNTRNLSNVEQINTSGDITDNGNTAWSVDGQNLIVSADQGITVSGTERLVTEGNITDSTNQGWAVKGDKSAYSSTNDLTVDNSSQITTTGSVTNDSNANQNVDLNTNSLVLAGMTFAGSKTYIGGASTLDTVTDNTGNAWDLTGNQALSNTTHNLSNVNQLNTVGDITDSNNGNWSVAGNNLASSTNYNVVIDGTGRIVTAGSATNASNSDQTVELNASSLKVAEITFDGSQIYIGSTTQSDTVTDTTDTDWNVTGVKGLTDDSRTLSNVDRLNASGAMTDEGNTAWSVDGKNLISSADQELTISGTSSLTTAGDITDKGNTAWSVDGANLISSNDQGITVSGTTKLATQGNITDTTNKGWAVQGDNVAFSSDNALTIDGTGQITTTGGITNASGETQAITLNSNHIKVAGIAFMGSTAYTGGDGNADTATDNNGNDWSLTALNTANDGNYYLSKVSGITTDTAKVTNNTGGSLKVDLNSDNLEVGAIQFKGVTSYEGDSTYDSVNDTQDSNWLVTGDNTANNTTYSFSNINAVTTTGEVTNDSNAQQDVTVDGDSIFLAGIDFIGSRIFNGATNFDDLVVDSSNRAWTLAAASQLSGNGFTLNNVEQITTNGNITDNLNSDWSLEAVSQNQNTVAKSTTGKMTVINSTRIASTGSVTNNSGSAQTLLLEDSGYTVAGISFDGSKVYIGTSGLNDIIDDETSTQASNSYTIEEAGKVTYQGYTFSEINEVQSQADVIDSVGSNWSVTGNTIASDGTITFKGMDAIQTVGGVTNNTNADQSVTLNTSSLTVAGITFDGSQNYTGSDSKKDTVTDSTNGAWSITGNRTLTDNTRNLSNVEQINTSGDITDNGNTAWSVDGQNLIVSADQGITVSGTKRLVTEGNITDSTNQGWAVKGDKSAYSSTNDLTVDNSSQITTTGSVTNDSNANQNVDLNTNSLVLAGMTFAGSKTYIGGASTLDTVTDNTGNAWDLTGNQALSNTTHNLSNVNQLNTVGDITDSNNGNWSVAGNNLASSTNYNVVIDGTGRIVSTGTVTNSTDVDQTVTLGVSSLSFADINFDGSTTYVGSTNQAATDTIVDNNNSDWSLTGNNALRSSTHTLSNVDVVSSTAAITNESGNTQTAQITDTQKANVAGIQFEDVTAYSGGSDNSDTVSGTDLTWQLQDTSNTVSAAGIAFTNIGAVSDDGSNNQLTGVAGNETYEVTGDAALTTKGMAISGIRMIYAGDGVDQVISNNSAEQWTLNGDNQIVAQGMTFHEIEQVNDLAANGTVKGSSGDDSITWTGNNTLNSYGVDFTGIKNIDTGAGNDTVYVDSALTSLDSLVGGDDSDTLVNRTEGLSWELTTAASKLGGFAFSSFENLSHTLSTLDLTTDSAVNLSVGSIGTPSAINKSISYTSPLDLLTLNTSSTISGTTDVTNINATAGGSIDVASTDTLTIDRAVSQSGDVTFTANSGDLNVNYVEANGGAGTANLTSNTGNIYAVAKDTTEPHIVAKTTNFTALIQVGDQVNQFVIDSTTDGQVNIISATYVSPVFTDATPEVVSVGDQLLSINEAVALSAFRTTSQQLADELGSVDPAIFTQLNNFNVGSEGVALPLEGDFLLVENGLTSIQALPSDATAAGEEEEEETY